MVFAWDFAFIIILNLFRLSDFVLASFGRLKQHAIIAIELSPKPPLECSVFSRLTLPTAWHKSQQVPSRLVYGFYQQKRLEEIKGKAAPRCSEKVSA